MPSTHCTNDLGYQTMPSNARPDWNRLRLAPCFTSPNKFLPAPWAFGCIKESSSMVAIPMTDWLARGKWRVAKGAFINSES
jgi:hypothetical protein